MTPADQLSMNFTAPFVKGSTTSRAAAKAIEPVAGTQRARILMTLRGWVYTGATDGELCFMCELDGSTVRPRRQELQKAGLIVDSGRTRKTSSGRDATVWVAVEYQA